MTSGNITSCFRPGCVVAVMDEFGFERVEGTLCNGMVLSFVLADMLGGKNPSNTTWPKDECSQMTYEERVEQAIAANDIETLVKFTYGYPCKCTKIKGEPMCICKMLERVTRAKIVPLPLFSGKIERV